MCGRYYLNDNTIENVWKQFPTIKNRLDRIPHGDIMPSADAPAILAEGKGLAAKNLIWGFTGYDGKKLLINARSESAMQKPTFSDSLRHHRCVIPAAGFYEWDRSRDKVSFFIKEKPVLYLAGLFRPEGSDLRFVILTREANESMLPVHERMPLMISEGDVESWILDDTKIDAHLRGDLPALDSYREYEQLSLFND